MRHSYCPTVTLLYITLPRFIHCCNRLQLVEMNGQRLMRVDGMHGYDALATPPSFDYQIAQDNEVRLLPLAVALNISRAGTLDNKRRTAAGGLQPSISAGRYCL